MDDACIRFKISTNLNYKREYLKELNFCFDKEKKCTVKQFSSVIISTIRKKENLVEALKIHFFKIDFCLFMSLIFMKLMKLTVKIKK